MNNYCSEVVVEDPPWKRKISIDSLRRVSELPEEYRRLFPFPFFNAIQSQLFDILLSNDDPVVVSAPTGSGKTVLFELAMVRLIETSKVTENDLQSKVVYLAPVKALCSERYADWKDKFSSLNIRTIEITGDTDNSSLPSIQDFDIILTTPEKWDLLTRKWKDHKNIVKYIKLFFIDEVHLLNEERRGATLEAVISRMKTIQETSEMNQSSSSKIRFVAVSATIPNITDVAQWLGSLEKPAHYFHFGQEMRPVRLRTIVKAYPCKAKTNSYMFDVSLSYKLPEIVRQYSEGKPTMIFCSTRKGVIQTCTVLIKEISFLLNEEQLAQIRQSLDNVTDAKLKEYLEKGIGYHHAGLSPTDRASVTELFREGNLPILCCTSTLAMGVNLPAHLVIIKSTEQCVGSYWTEYPEGNILQMMGRAGRPQFQETTATAVIMTKQDTKDRYERLVNGKTLVESCLHRYLVEHLNAEVVLGTITDIAVAMKWLASTFLWVRAFQNPRLYGLPVGRQRPDIEANLQDMCMRELNKLQKYGLLEKSDDAYDVKPTPNGILMARHYLGLDTMIIFMEVKGTESIAEILELICRSNEFDVILRTNEKTALNTLNFHKELPTIRYSMPGKIKTKQMKTNCLIQAVLGCLPISEPSINQEAARVVRVAERLVFALGMYLWKMPHFQSLVSTLTLSKALKCHLWDNSPYISRQLPGIGPALAALLSSAGKTTFQSIRNSNPRDLERIVNRHPPFGNQLHEAISRFPRYSLHLEYNKDASTLILRLSLVNWEALKDVEPYHRFSLIVGTSENQVLCKEHLSDGLLIGCKGEYTMKMFLPASNFSSEITAILISESIAGVDVEARLSLSSSYESLPKTSSSTSVQDKPHKFMPKPTFVEKMNARFLYTEKPKLKHNTADEEEEDNQVSSTQHNCESDDLTENSLQDQPFVAWSANKPVPGDFKVLGKVQDTSSRKPLFATPEEYLRGVQEYNDPDSQNSFFDKESPEEDDFSKGVDAGDNATEEVDDSDDGFDVDHLLEASKPNKPNEDDKSQSTRLPIQQRIEAELNMFKAQLQFGGQVSNTGLNDSKKTNENDQENSNMTLEKDKAKFRERSLSKKNTTLDDTNENCFASTSRTRAPDVRKPDNYPAQKICNEQPSQSKSSYFQSSSQNNSVQNSQLQIQTSVICLREGLSSSQNAPTPYQENEKSGVTFMMAQVVKTGQLIPQTNVFHQKHFIRNVYPPMANEKESEEVERPTRREMRMPTMNRDEQHICESKRIFPHASHTGTSNCSFGVGPSLPERTVNYTDSDEYNNPPWTKNTQSEDFDQPSTSKGVHKPHSSYTNAERCTYPHSSVPRRTVYPSFTNPNIERVPPQFCSFDRNSSTNNEFKRFSRPDYSSENLPIGIKERTNQHLTPYLLQDDYEIPKKIHKIDSSSQTDQHYTEPMDENGIPRVYPSGYAPKCSKENLPTYSRAIPPESLQTRARFPLSQYNSVQQPSISSTNPFGPLFEGECSHSLPRRNTSLTNFQSRTVTNENVNESKYSMFSSSKNKSELSQSQAERSRNYYSKTPLEETSQLSRAGFFPAEQHSTDRSNQHLFRPLPKTTFGAPAVSKDKMNSPQNPTAYFNNSGKNKCTVQKLPTEPPRTIKSRDPPLPAFNKDLPRTKLKDLYQNYQSTLADKPILRNNILAGLPEGQPLLRNDYGDPYNPPFVKASVDEQVKRRFTREEMRKTQSRSRSPFELDTMPSHEPLNWESSELKRWPSPLFSSQNSFAGCSSGISIPPERTPSSYYVGHPEQEPPVMSCVNPLQYRKPCSNDSYGRVCDSYPRSCHAHEHPLWQERSEPQNQDPAYSQSRRYEEIMQEPSDPLETRYYFQPILSQNSEQSPPKKVGTEII